MRRGVFAGAVIAVATVVLPGAVRAVTTTQITCDFHVTHSIVVKNSIDSCTGVGLHIDAKNITLNLNGQTIEGEGVDSGIDDSAGWSGLTILNGSVANFVSGIAVTTGSKLKIDGVSSYDNSSTGILADGTVGVTIQNSYTRGNASAGIDVVENAAGPVNVSGNASNGDLDAIKVTGGPATISGNVLANEGDVGILVDGDGYKVTNNRVISAGGGGVSGEGVGTVTGNTITRAGTFGIITNGGQIMKNFVGVTTNAGIYVAGSAKTTVSDNQVVSSSDSGIDVNSAGAGSMIQNNVIGNADIAPGIHSGADGITIKGNSIGTVSGGGFGIATQGNHVTIMNNHVGSASTGIAVESGSQATVSGNTVANAGTGEGIQISVSSSKIMSNTVLHAGDHAMWIDAFDANVIQSNLLEGAAHDGLRLDPGGADDTIKGNIVRGNNQNGINDESDSGSVLTANVAVNNSIVGISTTHGADGGKNKAAYNQVAQCSVNLVCTTH